MPEEEFYFQRVSQASRITRRVATRCSKHLANRLLRESRYQFLLSLYTAFFFVPRI